MGSTLDRYDQFAVISMAPTAAASGSLVTQLVTGLSNLQKVAWAVTKLEYWLERSNYSTLFTAGAQFIRMGVQNAATAHSGAQEIYSDVIDLFELFQVKTPAALGEEYETMPFVHDFGPNPRLLLPQMVYGFLQWNLGAALGTTNRFDIRIYYKEIELGPQDWYDLLQLRMPLGAT